MKIKFSAFGEDYSLDVKIRLCTIARLTDSRGYEIGKGFAVKNNDGMPFNEALGNKIAIGRALKDAQENGLYSVDRISELAALNQSEHKTIVSWLTRQIEEVKDSWLLKKARQIFQRSFGEVPPSLRVLGTSTGLVSASRPNLQNMPIQLPDNSVGDLGGYYTYSQIAPTGPESPSEASPTLRVRESEETAYERLLEAVKAKNAEKAQEQVAYQETLDVRDASGCRCWICRQQRKEEEGLGKTSPRPLNTVEEEFDKDYIPF